MIRFTCDVHPVVCVDEVVAMNLLAQLKLPRLPEFGLDADQTFEFDRRLWEFRNRIEAPGASSMVPMYEELCRVVLELRVMTYTCVARRVGLTWSRG